ncbi:MAG: hypothetical protein J5714_02590 [Alphaproteobacteria bacterium]|nr:hypothetical protein [Alphaproteobacteria bacterium]
MSENFYDFEKFKVCDFSNINVHTDNTSSDNCYGTCNDNSCDISCDCVCDADWGCDSFQREAEKEREMILARRQAETRKYASSKKQSKNKTEKAVSDKLDSMSEEELLNLIQLATQALAKKQTEKHTSR